MKTKTRVILRNEHDRWSGFYSVEDYLRYGETPRHAIERLFKKFTELDRYEFAKIKRVLVTHKYSVAWHYNVTITNYDKDELLTATLDFR